MIFFPFLGNQSIDKILLWSREGYNPHTSVRVVFYILKNQICYKFGFFTIGFASSIKNTIYIEMVNTNSFMLFCRRRKCYKQIVVKMKVRKSNQLLIMAPVMPRQTLCVEHRSTNIQYGFEVSNVTCFLFILIDIHRWNEEIGGRHLFWVSDND